MIAVVSCALLLQQLVAAEVSFSRDIAPILQSKCSTCHGAEKTKGGYRVDTYRGVLKTGKSKEMPIVAGKPEESELFKRLVTADLDDRMPQKDDPLPSDKIELFRSWITSGAALDRGDTNAPLATLIPKPPHPAPPEKYRRPVPILALAFTPDGRQLAAGGLHEVTFWNLQGELTRRLTNIPQRVRSIAFVPGLNLLAVAGGQPGRSGELSLYHLDSGARETNLLQTADEILCAAVSPDGKQLACGGTDNAIHLFDLERLTRVSTIQQHADWVTALAFNTYGALIASASRDRTARVYSALNGDLEATYTGQTVPLSVVSFLADGTVLSGGRDKTLHLWDPKDGRKKAELTGFSADAHALLLASTNCFTASADGSLRQHSFPANKLLRTLVSSGETIYSLAADPASQRLASAGYEGAVNIWNISDGALVKTFVAAPGWGSAR